MRSPAVTVTGPGRPTACSVLISPSPNHLQRTTPSVVSPLVDPLVLGDERQVVGPLAAAIPAGTRAAADHDTPATRRTAAPGEPWRHPLAARSLAAPRPPAPKALGPPSRLAPGHRRRCPTTRHGRRPRARRRRTLRRHRRGRPTPELPPMKVGPAGARGTTGTADRTAGSRPAGEPPRTPLTPGAPMERAAAPDIRPPAIPIDRRPCPARRRRHRPHHRGRHYRRHRRRPTIPRPHRHQ